MKSIIYIARYGWTISVSGSKHLQGLYSFVSLCAREPDLYRDDILQSLGRQVKELQIGKGELGWDLEALEAATEGVEERDSDSDDTDSDDGPRGLL